MRSCSHTCDHGPMGRPKTGKSPIRRFRAPDPFWEAVKAKAAAEHRTPSAVIMWLLTDWLRKPPDPRRVALGERTIDEETGD